MSEPTVKQTPAEQLAALPEPAAFECLENRFRHGMNTFRKGNTYHTEDFPDVNKDEVFLFWRAGWVKVEGWPDTPARDPSRKIVLDVHNIRILGKSSRGRARNG